MQITAPSNRNTYSPEAEKGSDQERFLQAFAATCSVQKASQLAKVRSQTHYDWLREDPTYSSRFRQARMWAAQRLEDEAVRRAIEGVRRPLLYKGKQVYIQGRAQYRVEYSDRLLICLLEALLPQKYGPQTKPVRLSMTDMNLAGLTDDQLEMLERFWLSTLGDKERKLAEAEWLIDDEAPPA